MREIRKSAGSSPKSASAVRQVAVDTILIKKPRVLRVPNPTDAMPSEHTEQALFVQWFRRTYPDVRIFAIPNGGSRSRSQGAKLKVEGVSAGVPDLFIPHGSIWVEMKRAKGGSLSAEQKSWHSYLRGIGQTVIVGYGFEDAKDKILSMDLNMNVGW